MTTVSKGVHAAATDIDAAGSFTSSEAQAGRGTCHGRYECVGEAQVLDETMLHERRHCGVDRQLRDPAIIVSASGMAAGGRVVQHALIASVARLLAYTCVDLAGMRLEIPALDHDV